MSLVVDASFLVAALVDTSPKGNWAERIIEEHDVMAPHLALVESANILRRMELAERLTPLESASAYRDLLQLPLQLIPYSPLANRIWELRTNLTAYDAWYVAAAESLDLSLATLDLRLSRAPGPTCSFLTPS